jgi:hypothetical protein
MADVGAAPLTTMKPASAIYFTNLRLTFNIRNMKIKVPFSIFLTTKGNKG